MSHQLPERWNSTELVRGERTPLVAQSKPGDLQKTEESGDIPKLATSSPSVVSSRIDQTSFAGSTNTIQGIQAHTVNVTIKQVVNNYQGPATVTEQAVIVEPLREVVRPYQPVFVVAAPHPRPSSFAMPWSFIAFVIMALLGFLIVSLVVVAAYRTLSAPTGETIREKAIPRTFFESLE